MLALASGNERLISDAMERAAAYDSDWEWVQDRCLDLLDEPSTELRLIALHCLSVVARMRRRLNLDKVIPKVEEQIDIEIISENAEDALMDIEMFVDSE